ncbi:MAG TPA: alcohol dehydrogenase catalytic domain-containing protein [Candidatus Hydrogenedentes bacterium]|nr:alcohol dehydrogenase catalytic domain-containing protein [Candidatus Hydrogenedentota bacterium]HOS01938.1 alcohol dehydrogenase catalytic domain-containing protein [Candidatus Hydrogenedentota bacterium]
MANLEQYRKATGPLPGQYEAWQIFGAGFDNVGKSGKPVVLPLREPKSNEVLLRVDAVGLCQSDIKIIKQGNAHARLRGRNLAADPTVLGHECSVTVVKVGKQWANAFKPGDRFIVQADIYYKGENFAFGYLIPGGLAEYAYLDERALAGDEGCYLLPVQPDTGYSAAALSEPWACVEMSYSLEERLEPGNNQMLIVTDEPSAWDEANPDAILAPRSLDGLGDAKYDDIIVPAPTPAMVAELARHLRKNGVMFLLGKPAESGPVLLDIGRIHYEGIRIYGGGDDMDAIRAANVRHDLKPRGSALFLGAGGPMGQMHVQRACELPNGPSRVVVTDLDRARLDHIAGRFGDIARANGVELLTFAPSQFNAQAEMDAHLRSLAPDGYDDVVVMVAVAGLVPGAVSLAADGGLVNIFAGVGIGSGAGIELDDLCRGVKMFGSSGSRISDLAKVLRLVEEKKLNTNLSVAAIGGLACVREGLEGVEKATYPGKVVIYTQIPDLPLIPVDEAPQRLPDIAETLGPGRTWTQEAENALLEKYAK